MSNVSSEQLFATISNDELFDGLEAVVSRTATEEVLESLLGKLTESFRAEVAAGAVRKAALKEAAKPTWFSAWSPKVGA